MDTVSASHNASVRRARWSLRLSGAFELIELSGGGKVDLPGKRDRVLIAYLALSRRGSQPRRKLATLLWGDAGDATALDNLRVCVWSLRKALGDSERQVIVREGEDIVLDAQAFEVDVLTFRQLAAQSGRPELEEAAKLYAGELLEGLNIDSEEFESWRRGEAARFQDQAIDVFNRLMAQLSEAGETERAIDVGTRTLRLEPLHEPTVRHLMRLYGESGRRGTAVQLYRTLADGLRTELNAKPEAETRLVFAEIAQGGDSQTQPQAVVAKPPLHPASMVRPSDTSGEPPQPLEQQLVSAIGALRQAKTRMLGWMPAAGLVAALAVFLLYQFAASTDTTTVQQTAKADSSSPASAISIAVLPFANLSGDASQEFFSDGMTEEITSALARIPGLIVIGRTSAFQFKGQNQDLRAIGQALNAGYLIEGSVRKAGDRVRITAQLIRAESGAQLWTENYDRELTDIFAVQEDIAHAITASLRMPLGLKPGENLVNNRSVDPDSYQQYLHARALISARGSNVAEGAALLEQVVARNPEYAPAWAQLASAYSLAPIYHPARYGSSIEASRRAVDELLGKADAAAQRAVELDPGAVAYAPLGYLQFVRGKLLLAEDRYRQAQALDPNGPSLQGLALLLATVGRLKEALALKEQLQAVEPFVPLLNRTRGLWLWADGQTDAAIAIRKTLPSDPDNNGSLSELAMIYASLGRYAEAADLLESLPGARPKDAARLLRTVPVKAAAPQSLPSLGNFGWVYLYVGAPERSLESYERDVQNGWSGGIFLPLVWHPSFAPVRKTERFKMYARKAGLVNYWRARGWPEFCHPTTGDDFVCN